MKIRYAEESDLPRLCELHAELNRLHAAARPDIFRPGTETETAERLLAMLRDPDTDVLAAEEDGALCGFAAVKLAARPESAVTREMRDMHIKEICVTRASRRRGVASALIWQIRCLAREKRCERLELSLWTFNADAAAFYKALGFSAYKQSLELRV
jgi:ribosomal protein S18 acetylase RimI-like enzyme